MNKTYQICTRCVMDTSDKDITFDENGVCNHCHYYDRMKPTRVLEGDAAEKKVAQTIQKIQKAGKGKEYDCIIGVSGGVDSTYVAYKVKEMGLRPLAVHFDNGWNSELAVSNIEKIMKQLDIDLYTYVVDWDQFKDLQKAFLLACVPDGEIPTDHGILATLYKTAAKHNVKYIISGSNFQTEAILPKSWAYGHVDSRYIKALHKRFGTKKIPSFPFLPIWKLWYCTFIKRIKTVSILNYLPYNKEEALDLLENTLGWQNYGGKHHESTYTKFYQSYVLPKKFNIDKRRAHLATLICSGEITRENALAELEHAPFDPNSITAEEEYALKKLGITKDAWEGIVHGPNKSYQDYPNSFTLIQWVKKALNAGRKLGIFHR